MAAIITEAIGWRRELVWRGWVVLALALAVTPPRTLAAEAPRARLDTGIVTGARVGPAAVYRAIPYAAPPVGPLRWKPPASAAPWTGERAAAAPGPACPQRVTP